MKYDVVWFEKVTMEVPRYWLWSWICRVLGIRPRTVTKLVRIKATLEVTGELKTCIPHNSYPDLDVMIENEYGTQKTDYVAFGAFCTWNGKPLDVARAIT